MEYDWVCQRIPEADVIMGFTAGQTLVRSLRDAWEKAAYIIRIQELQTT